MRSPLCVLAVLLLAAALPSAALAWGPDGHMAVGAIAESRLTPEAAREAAVLLDGGQLGDNRVANWADFIRGNTEFESIYPHNDRWHYVDIPVAGDPASFRRPADGNDIVDQITRLRKVLADPEASIDSRRDALRFLVHFVADIHQPLHCAARGDDRGGNLVFLHSFDGTHFSLVTTPEHVPNLHKAWDEYLVNDWANGRWGRELANELLPEITPEKAAKWANGTPESWALESHELAVTHAYRYTDGTPLPMPGDGKDIDLTDANYIDGNLPVVREQLSKAGVRLAMIVNEALSGK